MPDEVTITIPRYAARYLAALLKRERASLSLDTSAAPVHTLQADATYDSIDQIEFVLPDGLLPEEPTDGQ